MTYGEKNYADYCTTYNNQANWVYEYYCGNYGLAISLYFCGAEGKICKAGACVRDMSCSTDADCLPGELCDNGICLTLVNITFCVDNDKDGYDRCTIGQPGDDGRVVDCNDNNANIHPGAIEFCDGIDNDCDGIVDEGCTNETLPFDLATTEIKFSNPTPDVGQLITIIKTVRNLGKVNGYITGGSSFTCFVNESCSAGGWGGGIILILSGETKYYYENYTFTSPGLWEVKRGYSGKGINNETDVNLLNNLKTEYISVGTTNDTVPCIDTDGGINLLMWGTACIGDKCNTDYCEDSTHVFEADCGYENGVIGSSHPSLGGSLQTCPSSYSCSNGACVAPQNQTTKTCNDTDGGLNYYLKGTVTSCIYGPSGGGCLAAMDYCRTNSTVSTLTEGYCSGTIFLSKQVICSYGCANDGACVKRVTPWKRFRETIASFFEGAPKD